ncbi:hypothetical protein GF385_04690, partial [Candidatus Dependentiae bacterium]|nr:hypothetical protein [Candidatus Dependentiae bacterium]
MQKKDFYIKTVLFLFILILPSCGYQKFSRNQVVKNIDEPVFIQMPKNPLVFENISSMLYKALFLTYKRLGYKLSEKQNNSFILKTKIKSLEPIEKFISQDLLLYNVRIGISISCKLVGKNQKVLAEKIFEHSRLISFPRDPIQSSKFLDYEYKKLMDRISIKIEHYFRVFLFNKN